MGIFGAVNRVEISPTDLMDVHQKTRFLDHYLMYADTGFFTLVRDLFISEPWKTSPICFRVLALVHFLVDSELLEDPDSEAAANLRKNDHAALLAAAASSPVIDMNGRICFDHDDFLRLIDPRFERSVGNVAASA